LRAGGPQRGPRRRTPLPVRESLKIGALNVSAFLANRSVDALLIGLDEPWGASLGNTLSADGNAVRSVAFETPSGCLHAVRRSLPDVVFCSVGCCRQVLADLRGERLQVPVVAVSRLPEVGLWLDALEWGAVDYCAAPFEPRQVRWVLQTSLQARANPIC
jgi:DNA-binding response OmpR family regulator